MCGVTSLNSTNRLRQAHSPILGWGLCPAGHGGGEEVLAALAGSPTIAHPLVVAALGDTTITEEALVKALRYAPRGKAPGADGLPVVGNAYTTTIR